MADTANTDRPLSDAEREEEERRRREGRPPLDEEIVRKYDRERLARLVQSGAGRGEFLDLQTRSEMERRLPGNDFSQVRIFRGSLAEEVTARYSADAITIANTGMVLVREGPRSAPGTTSGKALLAHELTHVAQAQRGMQFAREGGAEGEHEAEARSVEAETARAGDTAAQGANRVEGERRREMRNRQIVERVLELLRERQREQRERQGG
ncbi:MAG TPA: DUF4157 domain-containing protein [Polyangia bacterium]|jgi:hypothetical protein|nr:DUF4157 domain-containing protein [Polyangia bacterium]